MRADGEVGTMIDRIPGWLRGMTTGQIGLHFHCTFLVYGDW